MTIPRLIASLLLTLLLTISHVNAMTESGCYDVLDDKGTREMRFCLRYKLQSPVANVSRSADVAHSLTSNPAHWSCQRDVRVRGSDGVSDFEMPHFFLHAVGTSGAGQLNWLEKPTRKSTASYRYDSNDSDNAFDTAMRACAQRTGTLPPRY